jgi:hypothetical protein
MNIDLSIKDITPRNKHLKMVKAVRALSERLGIPVKKKEHKHGGKEPCLFRSHEELIYKWYNIFSSALDATYDFVVSYFGLPEVRIVSKAEVLRHRGKIIYSPETGEPIKQHEWDDFVKLLERFLNRRLKDTDKRIILDSKALGRILNRMLKYNRFDEVKAVSLGDVKYRGKTIDWISDSVKNMRTALGEELSRAEMARIQVLEMSAAQKITGISERVKSEIKQILIDGVVARKSKGQISQELFDKMTGRNRDFQMIADTEIQNALNNASLLDEVHSAKPGEKIYFQRVEVMDQNTCPFCRRMNGVIVLWSDHPLPSDKIDDPIADFAIWDGKNWDGKKEFVANGVFHPYCRGLWVRYNGQVGALLAHVQNHSELYNNALDQARAEWRAKGVENPNDKTPGFTERINEIFSTKSGEEVTQKSLHLSDYIKGFAVGHRGPLSIFVPSLSLSDVIKQVKKTASHYPGEAIYFSFPGGDNQTFESLEQAIQWFTENWQKKRYPQKSLTWSGHELQDRYKFAGFNISVENRAGSIRSGKDKDGHEWRCKMHFDYGYIRGSIGVDGDHVDVYIGPNEEAPNVYVVHQNDPVTGKYDEDKVMLGFSSEKAARQAYLKQYDRPGFLGDIDTIPLEEFREKVLAKKNHGNMIKSVSERVREALGKNKG